MTRRPHTPLARPPRSHPRYPRKRRHFLAGSCQNHARLLPPARWRSQRHWHTPCSRRHTQAGCRRTTLSLLLHLPRARGVCSKCRLRNPSCITKRRRWRPRRSMDGRDASRRRSPPSRRPLCHSHRTRSPPHLHPSRTGQCLHRRPRNPWRRSRMHSNNNSNTKWSPSSL